MLVSCKAIALPTCDLMVHCKEVSTSMHLLHVSICYDQITMLHPRHEKEPPPVSSSLVCCCCSQCLSTELWFLKIDFFFFFFSFVLPSFLLVAAVDVCLFTMMAKAKKGSPCPFVFLFFFPKKAFICNLRCLKSAQNMPSKIPYLLESRSAKAHTGSWQVLR